VWLIKKALAMFRFAVELTVTIPLAAVTVIKKTTPEAGKNACVTLVTSPVTPDVLKLKVPPNVPPLLCVFLIVDSLFFYVFFCLFLIVNSLFLYLFFCFFLYC
jgi:hypothetical protein